MSYNVIDILNKTIKIEEKNSRLLEEAINYEARKAVNLYIIKKVLKEFNNKRINKYNELIKEISEKELEEIDFMSYDKISFLFNEFMSKNTVRTVNTPKQYLLFALDIAKEKYSLFIDIQGRLMNNAKNSESDTYKVLSEILKGIKEQIDSINNTIV